MSKQTYWTGAVPDLDNFGTPIEDEFIDGALPNGVWAIMSPVRFRELGRGLGTGLGQKYRKQKDGRWLCVEGSSL